MARVVQIRSLYLSADSEFDVHDLSGSSVVKVKLE
jgi:hypothetical protein